MLGYWRPHKEYQSCLIEKMKLYYLQDKDKLKQYEKALSKLYILDLDPLKPLLSKYYASTGAPANNHP